MKKIVLTGSESSGKTELAERLAREYNAPVSKEFVRDYAAARGGKLTFADHGPIARGQIAAEDDAIQRGTAVVILDTDLVSTVVYCEHYFGSCPEWIVTEAQKRAGTLYLLIKPDVLWKSDGVRDRGDRRDEMHALFAARLESMGLRFVEIGGDRHARLASAIQAIDGTST